MSLVNRLVRGGIAFAVFGIIASQIPVNGEIAFADDVCSSDGQLRIIMSTSGSTPSPGSAGNPAPNPITNITVGTSGTSSVYMYFTTNGGTNWANLTGLTFDYSLSNTSASGAGSLLYTSNTGGTTYQTVLPGNSANNFASQSTAGRYNIRSTATNTTGIMTADITISGTKYQVSRRVSTTP